MVTVNKSAKRADGSEVNFTADVPADSAEARKVFNAFNDKTALRIVKQFIVGEARLSALKPEEDAIATAIRKGTVTPAMLEQFAKTLRAKAQNGAA